MGIVVAAGLLAVVLRLREPPQEYARLASQDFDFGYGKKAQIVSHSFEINNPFSSPLRISRVISSCSCTSAGNVSSVIEPQKKVTIPVEVHLTDYDDNFRQKVVVEFEGQPSIELSVHGKVIRPAPESIQFGLVLANKSEARDAIIRATTDKQLTITVMQYDQSLFSISSDVAGAESKDILLHVTLNPHVSAGPFSRDLVITTNDAELPQIHVRLEGRVAGLLEPDAHVLNFGLISDHSKVALLRLDTPYGGEFHLQDIDTTAAPGVQAPTSGLVHRQTYYEIPITLTTSFPKSIAQGSIHILGQVDNQPVKITIDYYGMRAAQWSATRPGVP
jgi:hypothetical protein